MVCIRFQGIVIVLPIDKNKSKVFGKREGFFVLIKRTACEGKYVYVLLYCKKSYIEPYIISTDHIMYVVHVLSCVYWDISVAKNQMECINIQVLHFMVIIMICMLYQNLKSFLHWLDIQLTNPTFLPIITKLKFHE